MNVTREVLKDLLPAYLAGEASADTRALVEEFVRQDPEFAAVLDAQRRELAAGTRVLREPGAGLAPDHELQTLARTRRAAERMRALMAFAILCTAFPFSLAFSGGRVTFLLFRDVPSLAKACWVAAAFLWAMFWDTRRRLSGGI